MPRSSTLVSMFHYLLLSLFAVQIQLGDAVLDVEIAQTEKEREKGLMGRDQLPANSGMLFVFEKSKILDFWMKDTSIPLAIGFFDEDRTFFQAIEMIPKTETIYRSKKPARYALEVNHRWFKTHHIRAGMKFYFKDPGNAVKSLSLGETK